MDAILQCMPPQLRGWAASLSPEDIAHILTTLAGASKPAARQPAVVGQLGEDEVQAMLVAHGTIVRSAAKRGDFILTAGRVRIMIEVKNYSKTVPRTEYQKFLRDLDACRGVAGGLMISLNAPFAGVARPFDFHKAVGGIPVVMMNLGGLGSLAAEAVGFAIDTLVAAACQGGRVARSTIDQIAAQFDNLSQTRLLISDTQTLFNNQFAKMMQSILAAEAGIRHALETARDEKKDDDDLAAEGGLDTVKVAGAIAEDEEAGRELRDDSVAH
jgi:hypothetical protein